MTHICSILHPENLQKLTQIQYILHAKLVNKLLDAEATGNLPPGFGPIAL